MSVQRLHPNLAAIDLLTREELEETMQKQFSAHVRELERGKDVIRIPFFPITATAATQNLFTSNDQTPWGPEQGDVWMIRGIIVKSSSFTDTARYQIFRGSTPSDTANAYSFRFLLEGGNAAVPAVNQPVPPAIAVGASPFTFVNVQPYTVNVTVTGGTVTSITVNGANTGATSGTFALLPDANMVVTYTVAPTMTEVNATANTAAVPLGIPINTGFYFPNKARFLLPGEQVYIQIQNATIGNQYVLDGEGIRIPAEMKGKIL